MKGRQSEGKERDRGGGGKERETSKKKRKERGKSGVEASSNCHASVGWANRSGINQTKIQISLLGQLEGASKCEINEKGREKGRTVSRDLKTL